MLPTATATKIRAKKGDNGTSSISEPHEIHCHERREGCVEVETASTNAGCEDKVVVVVQRYVGVEGMTTRCREDEES
jgi:hypothetical protein